MKSFHIAAYTYRADIVCCDCIAEFAESELRECGYSYEEIEKIAQSGPDYDSGVFGYRSEALLTEVAKIEEIDYSDYYSFDTDDFPKVIFADQIETREYCGECRARIR